MRMKLVLYASDCETSRIVWDFVRLELGPCKVPNQVMHPETTLPWDTGSHQPQHS